MRLLPRLCISHDVPKRLGFHAGVMAPSVGGGEMSDGKWMDFALRVIGGLVAVGAYFLADPAPLWQVVAGILYGLLIPYMEGVGGVIRSHPMKDMGGV